MPKKVNMKKSISVSLEANYRVTFSVLRFNNSHLNSPLMLVKINKVQSLLLLDRAKPIKNKNHYSRRIEKKISHQKQIKQGA